MKIESQIPVLLDQQTDLDKFLTEFENVLDCHTFGRRKVRPFDRLMLFKRCFPPGSARLLVYDGAIRRARRRGLLPGNAEHVYQDIITEMRKTVRETLLQRQERVEAKFAALSMGALPHGKFRVMWEDKLEDMEEANMDKPAPATLYRKYLGKLPIDLRTAVLGRTWPLDGPDQPHRMCETWEDLADAVELELEKRFDARAAPLAKWRCSH